jgi:hypothetical protein
MFVGVDSRGVPMVIGGSVEITTHYRIEEALP